MLSPRTSPHTGAHRSPTRRLSAIALVAALAVAACGGGSDDGDGDSADGVDDTESPENDESTETDEAESAEVDASGSPEEVAASLCALADPAEVAAAVGLDEVTTKVLTGLDPTCAFAGPDENTEGLNLDIDRPLEIVKIDRLNFAPTTNELEIDGADASQLSENDTGWFSIEVVVGEDRLRVWAGTNLDGEQYNTPELRALADEIARSWAAS